MKASSKMDCDNVMRPQKILNESVNLASFSELNLSNPVFFIPWHLSMTTTDHLFEDVWARGL